MALKLTPASCYASFIARVLVDQKTGCWLWQGGRYPEGYGFMRSYKGVRVRSHRYSYEYHKGPIPFGMCVCHKCDNPPCCNPEHLWLGTDTDNVADRNAKGRTARGDSSGSRLHPGSHRGEANGHAKLTEARVRQVKRLHSIGTTRAALAARFGVGWGTIDSILAGRTWVHVV